MNYPDPADFDGHPTDVPNGFWNLLRAAVLDGRMGGADDGADQYDSRRPAIDKAS